MLSCCCSLAGTEACLRCPRYVKYHWHTPPPQAMQSGWVCPQCKKVHAPSVVSCGCQKPIEKEPSPSFSTISEYKYFDTAQQYIAVAPTPKGYYVVASLNGHVWDVYGQLKDS